MGPKLCYNNRLKFVIFGNPLAEISDYISNLDEGVLKNLACQVFIQYTVLSSPDYNSTNYTHGCFYIIMHIEATVITLGVTLKCHYCGLLVL